MANFALRINNQTLEKGWSAKLVAEFEPIADCGEESFWVRVEEINDQNGTLKYIGVVKDYLTYTKSHGMTMGFMIEFAPEHVSEVRAPGQ